MNQPLITKQLLIDFGIELDGKDVDALLNHLNTTLDERVGSEITEALDDDKLKELLALQENGSDEEIGEWIGKNVPELEEITQDEVDILLGEVAENADDINKTA